MIPRSTVDPWPCHKGHELESDRRADGAKSNAATVAMSSSTILFKTAITNCRALLLYDDGAGTRSRITRKDGEACPKHDWGITGGLKMEFILLSLTLNSERYNTRCITLRPSEITMSSFNSYSHFISTKIPGPK